MTTLFGITSCDSCRTAKKWLLEHDVEVIFHDLRADGHNKKMLQRWTKALGWESLLNKRSLTWRRIPEADRQNLNAAKAIELMLENPTLIKRPLLETPQQVTVGFSAKSYAELFKKP